MKTLCGYCLEQIYVHDHSPKECEMLQGLKNKMNISLRDIQNIFKNDLMRIFSKLEALELSISIMEKRLTALEIEKANIDIMKEKKGNYDLFRISD